MLKVHRVLGVLVLVSYALLLWRLTEWMPLLSTSLTASSPVSGSAVNGHLVILGLPLAAAICWLMPERLMWRWSPRPRPSFDYLLAGSFWIVLGYVLLVLAALLLLLFRSFD